MSNLIVAQSGGPSPVINNSLCGIVEAARDHAVIDRVYGALHGIEGVLKEELIDLSAQPQEEIALLGVTPAAGFIGTCRYKLRSEQQQDFQRVIDVFRAHDIGYFLYIGGNDSMDTADKVAQVAHQRGLDLISIGVPKTIDNDMGDSAFRLIDHTPGYGSTAKYWMHMVQFADEENRGSSPADPVLVLQAMGRKIGFIPAAARLADPHRALPLIIFLAERACSLEQLADHVNDQLRQSGRAIVVISEGFDVGNLGEVKDAFGHTSFSSSHQTVAGTVVNYLNTVGLAARGAARGNIPGTDQRHNMAFASTVDLAEAYEVGRKAVELAAAGESGFMATILRELGSPYRVRYDKAPLAEVANRERVFPADWISPDGTDVTDAFLEYAKPLVGEEMQQLPLEGGRIRLARLTPVFAEKRLEPYEPQANR
ncbi:MAG: diphosphate--fructose-6-phosphate 1-phosphotransferase [Pirellulales bacterium]|nr:diphosphate--fructose-6-phosphate 1-phosphotransferase [Pirellulales bacterium]